MNSLAERLYARAPIGVQHLMTSAYGLAIYPQRYGGSFGKYVAQLRNDEWHDLDYLMDLQNHRLRQMVHHAYDYTPYYRELLDTTGLKPSDIKDTSDLTRIPVLEKHTLRASIDSFRSRAFQPRTLICNPTAGTTGSAIPVLVTRDAMQYNFATYEARALAWAGVTHRDRTATFLGRIVAPIGQSKPPFWRHNWVRNQLLFSSFHMTDDHLPSYVDRLASFRPRLLVGYCSSIYTLASHIVRSKRAGEVRPVAVLVSSEVLLPDHRKVMEQAFGCRVFDGYSQAELCGFVTECSRGRLHVSPEYGVIEFIPLDQPPDGGQPYEMLCTGLFNLATPILRYRIGDLAVPARDPCPCGRSLPVVESIIGRSDSMIVTPNGARVSPASMSLAFKLTRGIAECQIIQRAVDHIIICIVRTPEYDHQQQAYMLKEVRRRVGSGMQIEIEFVEKLLGTESGKVRFVISELRDADGGGGHHPAGDAETD